MITTNNAILFDLDDTLLDDLAAKQYYMPRLYKTYESVIKFTEKDFFIRWKEAIPKYHKKYTNSEMTFEEQRLARIKDSFGNDNLSTAEAEEIILTFDLLFKQSWKLMSGALEILEHFKDIPKGLITNGSSDQQNDKIDTLNIRAYFYIIIISQDAGFSKPDTRIFKKASDFLKVKPENCWFVGDSWEADVEGSINAGMNAVWLNRYDRKKPFENSKISEIKELNDLKALT